MDVQERFILFKGVICCSGGLYAVQEGYMDAQEGCILFRGVICCSGGLYAVQVGYMDVQEGYMMKKIMMILLATNVVASRPPERLPTETPTARANVASPCTSLTKKGPLLAYIILWQCWRLKWGLKRIPKNSVRLWR